MRSKLETRIITQRFHGISNREWWKLTDEEQDALIAEAGIPCHENLGDGYRCTMDKGSLHSHSGNPVNLANAGRAERV